LGRRVIQADDTAAGRGLPLSQPHTPGRIHIHSQSCTRPACFPPTLATDTSRVHVPVPTLYHWVSVSKFALQTPPLPLSPAQLTPATALFQPWWSRSFRFAATSPTRCTSGTMTSWRCGRRAARSCRRRCTAGRRGAPTCARTRHRRRGCPRRCSVCSISRRAACPPTRQVGGRRSRVTAGGRRQLSRTAGNRFTRFTPLPLPFEHERHEGPSNRRG
jgi:hypothetical protein